jgi:apolipoprotein N-acyltransferase
VSTNQGTSLTMRSGIFAGAESSAPRLWIVLVLEFVLGFVGALALPPVGLWPLLVALALGFSVARNQSKRRAGISGFAMGLGYFAFALHWIGYAFLVDADAYLWMMPFAVGGLSALMAVYWGLAFVAARFLMRFQVPWFAAFPAALGVLEVLRGILFTGFPWAPPGLVADGMGGVLQLASLVGMQGLSFWLLFWASLLVALIVRDVTGRGAVGVAVVFLALLPAAWLWGLSRTSGPAEPVVSGVRLLLVQPNVAQNEKWQSENAGAIFEQLMRMSKATGVQPTHIIWPESAVPFLLDESQGARAAIATQFQDGQTLLTGAVRRAPRGDDTFDYFTSILVFDHTGKILDTYDKWHLVPGGEYLPMAWLLEPLGFRKVVNVPESFTAGPGARSLNVPGAGLAGMLICYEAIFPGSLIDIGQRPQWLVNVTNDGWFGLSTGPYQHLAQVRMRAVEQNLPVARAANSGISAIIDGKGRFIARSELGVEAALIGVLPKAGEIAIFARFGLWLSFLVMLVAVLSVAYWCNKPLNTHSDSF